MHITSFTPKPQRLIQLKLLIPLLIIFISQCGSALFTPDLLKIVSVHQHFLNPGLSQNARNFLFGLLLGTGPFVAIFTTPILGSLSDRWGRKKVLVISMSVLIASTLLSIIGIHVESFILLLFAGLLSGFHMVKPLAKAALADETAAEQRKLYFAWATLAITLSGAVGVLAGAFLSNQHYVHHFFLQAPYFVNLLILLLALMIILFLFKEPKHHYDLKIVSISINPIKNFMAVGKEKQFIKPLFAFLLFEWAYALFCSDVPLFLHEFLGQDILHMSYYSAFNSSFTGLSLLLFYPLWIRYVPSARQITMPILGLAVCYLLFALFHTTTDQYLITLPLAAFAAIAYSLLMTLMASSVPEDKHGWALGMAYSVVQLVWFVAPVLMGPLNALSPYVPLFVAAGLALLSMMVLSKAPARLFQDDLDGQAVGGYK